MEHKQEEFQSPEAANDPIFEIVMKKGERIWKALFWATAIAFLVLLMPSIFSFFA